MCSVSGNIRLRHKKTAPIGAAKFYKEYGLAEVPLQQAFESLAVAVSFTNLAILR